MKYLFAVIGIVIGFGAAQVLQHYMTPRVEIAGTVLYEPPVDPVVTAKYPSGYYLSSRIYLPALSSQMLHKSLVKSGYLSSISTLEGRTYPQVYISD